MKDCKGEHCNEYPTTHSIECFAETARVQGWYDDFKKHVDSYSERTEGTLQDRGGSIAKPDWVDAMARVVWHTTDEWKADPTADGWRIYYADDVPWPIVDCFIVLPSVAGEVTK
jgi:hypothetical protein